MLVAFLIFTRLAGASWLVRLEAMIASVISVPASAELSAAGLLAVTGGALVTTAWLLAAPLGVMTVAGLAGNLVQGPLTWSAKPLQPKFKKLNPVQGIKKVFSLRQLVEVLKGVIKMALFGAVAFTAVRDVFTKNPVGAPGAEGTLSTIFFLIGSVVLRVTIVAAGLALLDYLFRRYDHTRNLMMSKREIREEFKEREGDPLTRARIREKQRALARSRMMADVPRATVVITNPTHYAVALRYVPGELDAPKLLAKGTDRLAARIREIATEHSVPIISDPPLARALYRNVPLNAEIPETLFRAVAEVLALVMTPDRRRRKRRTVKETRP